MTHAGRTQSTWMQYADIPVYPPLGDDIEADICIVGAGIAGLSIAYELAKAGRSVTVLDDGPIGGGETQRTTAHLASAIDDRFTEIERIHGGEGSRLAAQAHAKAIDRIEEIAVTERIDCTFLRLDGYLVLPPGEDASILEEEMNAATRAGLEVERTKLPYKEYDFGKALRFAKQGQFHPRMYLRGLAEAVVRNGGVIHTGTHVREMDEKTLTLQTDDGQKITAKAIVLATNAPIFDNAWIYAKQAPYRSFVIAAAIPKGSVPPMLLWDTQDPYHYVRTHEESDGKTLLIVGGEDHKTAHADDGEERFRRLEEWTRERFPMIGPVLHQWSGQVMETIDGLAMIGKKPGSNAPVYIATGDSGMGMTHGVIAGMLLSDLINGREHPWAALFSPSRTPLGALGTFAKENLGVARDIARDYLSGGEVDDETEVKKGCGALIREGVKKIALYRDDAGTMHRLSAVCPHKGCIVHWNSTERSWDCPCHGSRFDPAGRVLNGPTSAPLPSVE